MRTLTRKLLLVLMCCVFSIVLSGCGKTAADDSTSAKTNGSSDSAPADEVPTEPANDTPAPLPDEQRYLDVLEIGLAFSYELTPDDGEVEILQNMEGYAAIQWSDDEGHEVLVVRRYVAGEPEEWTYQDEGSRGDGVTPDKPSVAQLDAWDGLAGDIVAAVEFDTAEHPLSRSYAWTDSASGIGSASYSFNGTTDDPQLNLNLGQEGRLSRFDLTIPML